MIVVISDSNDGKAYQAEVTGAKVGSLSGKKIGDNFDGKVVGLAGYELIITGGTDKSGFPMRKDIPGPAKRNVLVTGGTGYHPITNGRRKRKTIAGNEISSNTAQVNTKVTKYGQKALIEHFSTEEEKEE
ncbi:MAG: 30S ribosomal protein S6e [Halobacteriota archaeon]|nr:30S ribosomal protein S6e [Halobacteriota archaeon]